MSPIDPSAALKPAHWRKIFSATTHARGQAYAGTGRVSNLHIDNSDTETLVITAKVLGSARKHYAVRIEITAKAAGYDFNTECSCPVSFDCKHCVATLIVAGKSGDGQRVTGQRVQSTSPLTQWLSQFEAAARTYASRASATPPPMTEARKLAFVFNRITYNGLPQLTVSPIWVRQTAQGKLGKQEPVRLQGDLNDIEINALDNNEYELLARMRMFKPHYDAKYEQFTLTGPRGESLLLKLLATGKPCFWQKATNGPMTCIADRTLEWRWIFHDDGTQRLTPDADPSSIVKLEQIWLFDHKQNTIARVQATHDIPVEVLLKTPVIAPEHSRDIAAQWPGNEQLTSLPAPSALDTFIHRAPPESPVLTLMGHKEKSRSSRDKEEVFYARLSFDYAGFDVQYEAFAKSHRHMSNGALHIIHRDGEFEESAYKKLEKLTFDPISSRYDLPWSMHDLPNSDFVAKKKFKKQNAAEFLKLTDGLKAYGFTIRLHTSFPIEALPFTGEVEFDLQPHDSGEHWFETSLHILADGKRIPMLPILQAALTDPSFSLTPPPGEPADATLPVLIDGHQTIAFPMQRLRALIEPLLQWLDGGDTARIPRAALATLDESLATLHMSDQTRQALLAMSKQKGKAQAVITPPKWFRAELRDYQKDGLQWLHHLARHRLGGVLADDMGLGKTVQVLAHIAAEKQARRLKHPILVVVPTSVIGNWREQAQKFAPSLRVIVLHGLQRHAHFDVLQKHDIVITTYALLIRDREALIASHFHLVVYDEAQALKNHRSKSAMAARDIQADYRLAVTGTPLENHLGELWSQFDCVLPGVLGDAVAFTKHFRTPIEKHADNDRQTLLNRRIAPFMLRRTKQQVANELPQKTEIIIHIEIEGKQRELYETLRLAMHDKVRGSIAKLGLARSSIVILDALLKLRQACCDPRLVKLDKAKSIKDSAKLDALLPMLESMIDEGRNILLFSQFTEMLDLIEEGLREYKLPWVRLDGSTRDRDTPIKRFQTGECPLFLISLKAGGTGLNLTTADTVIHFDPWWNPAVERQATDRAHRIGQIRPVFVYKFICSGTVEEKIASMQQRKAALAEAVLTGGSRQSFKFDEEDIATLFAPLPNDSR